MLKPVRLLLVILLCSFAMANTDIKKMLCDKKWYMSYIKIGDGIVPVPDSITMANRPWVCFYSDGRFDNMLEQKLVTGSWSYDETKKEITTIEAKTSKVKSSLHLQKLSEDTLELSMPNQMTLGLLHPN